MKCHIGVDAGSGLVHTMTVTAANTHDITQAAALIREDDMVAILHRNCRNLAPNRLIPRMGTELTRFIQRLPKYVDFGVRPPNFWACRIENYAKL